MKRSRILLASALVAVTLVAGCGGDGIKEGMSTEKAPANGQPAGFQQMMERDANRMKNKGKPKNVPAPSKETQ